MNTAHFTQKDIAPEFIFQMREMSAEDLDTAADKLYRASQLVTVLEHQESELFDYYVVLSGDRPYEVTRLGWFVHCTCRDFEFSHTACKHSLVCMPQVCRKCFERPVTQRGKKCDRCEMSDAPYLPPTSNKPVERIGNFRI